MTSKIEVSSHVSRDLLQNAAYFSTLPKVVWEYVSNSLDNAKEDIPPLVIVELEGTNNLQVSDNGTGMSRADLARFFTMHAENAQRKKGRVVRGRFGTGKSAAFGVARTLRVDTVKNGRRNVVELTRSDIENAKDGEAFPVKEVAVNEPAEGEDGTLVIVTDFFMKAFDLEKTIAYIEKNLSRYKGRGKVLINGHECRSTEPPYEKKLDLSPPPEVKKVLGAVTLTLKISGGPLTAEESGIDILANGVWHETTMAGVKGDQADRLFGDVDVPALDEETDEIPAFDNTRNNQLNRSNPKVVVLLGWLQQELEKARGQIAEEERKRKRTEEAKRLAKRAKELARILNDDFNEVMDELEFAERVRSRRKVRATEESTDEGVLVPGDGTEKTPWQDAGRERGEGTGGDGLVPPGEEPREGGPDLIPGDEKGTKKKTKRTPGRRRRGAFSIEFMNMTSPAPRSKYDRETQTIYVNLDHPQVTAALNVSKGSTEASEFLQMAYEIAGVEYAQAIQYERLGQGVNLYPEDALYSVRETIERITRKFADVLG